MSNIKTLKRMKDRTPEERREISSRAGRASVKRRRELKETREYLKTILALPVDGLEAVGLPQRDSNHLAAITVALVQRAEAGDVRAAELVLKVLGEYPSERMELQTTETEPVQRYHFIDITPQEAHELAREWIQEKRQLAQEEEARQRRLLKYRAGVFDEDDPTSSAAQS